MKKENNQERKKISISNKEKNYETIKWKLEGKEII